MAVVINELEVTSEVPAGGARGGGQSSTAAGTPEDTLKRQIELTARRAAERAKRLVAD